MRPFPSFNIRLLLRGLVGPVREGVEELDGGLVEHRVPGAALRLGGAVYRADPAPAVGESIARAALIRSSIAAFFAGSFRRFASFSE